MDCISVTVKEAVRLTGIPRTTIYELIRDGALESFKVGRRRLITVESLQRFVDLQIADNEPAKLKPAALMLA